MACCNLASCWQYKSETSQSFYQTTTVHGAWSSSNQKHGTLSGVGPDFAKNCGTFFYLSQVIHISFFVGNHYRVSYDEQAEIRSSKSYCVNPCGTQTLSYLATKTVNTFSTTWCMSGTDHFLDHFPATTVHLQRCTWMRVHDNEETNATNCKNSGVIGCKNCRRWVEFS